MCHGETISGEQLLRLRAILNPGICLESSLQDTLAVCHGETISGEPMPRWRTALNPISKPNPNSSNKPDLQTDPGSVFSPSAVGRWLHVNPARVWHSAG